MFGNLAKCFLFWRLRNYEHNDFYNAREIIVHWPITESLGHARKTPDHKLIIT